MSPSIAGPAREGIAARLLVPAFWGAVSIVAMWLAVLFDGIYGGDMIFSNPGSGPTIIPSAVAVALFAFSGRPPSPSALSPAGTATD